MEYSSDEFIGTAYSQLISSSYPPRTLLVPRSVILLLYRQGEDTLMIGGG